MAEMKRYMAQSKPRQAVQTDPKKAEKKSSGW